MNIKLYNQGIHTNNIRLKAGQKLWACNMLTKEINVVPLVGNHYIKTEAYCMYIASMNYSKAEEEFERQMEQLNLSAEEIKSKVSETNKLILESIKQSNEKIALLNKPKAKWWHKLMFWRKKPKDYIKHGTDKEQECIDKLNSYKHGK